MNLFIIIVCLGFFFIPLTIMTAQSWMFAAVGDVTDKNVATKMKATAAEVHILLGDYYGKEKTVLPAFLETGVTNLDACGNHDDCKKVLKYDGMKFSGYPIGFSHKNIGFLILNTEDSISKQKTKAEVILKSFQNNSSIDSIIIAQHKPAITGPQEHHKETEAKGYREQFVIWKQQYPKFQMAIFGHNHNYLVCKPTNPKIIAITDGTGGRTPYPLGTTMDDGCGQGLSGKQYNGFTLFNVTNEGIQFKHINVK